MHRKSLGKYDGMLFIYKNKKTLCMWMKNTFIPLTVLFIDERGYVLEIKDMVPNTETPHCSEIKSGCLRGRDRMVKIDKHYAEVSNNKPEFC